MPERRAYRHHLRAHPASPQAVDGLQRGQHDRPSRGTAKSCKGGAQFFSCARGLAALRNLVAPILTGEPGMIRHVSTMRGGSTGELVAVKFVGLGAADRGRIDRGAGESSQRGEG
jgi:hypothetical protein